MKSINFPMKEAISRVTLSVNLTGLRAARFRLWLGSKLLLLAARVIGCGIEIKTEK